MAQTLVSSALVWSASWFAIIISWLMIAPSAQGERTLEPAAFTEKRSSLQRRIRFPEIEGDVSAELSCLATLSRKGRFVFNFCLSHAERAPLFQEALSAALRRAKLRPARKNGWPIGVLFQYRVHFLRSAEETSIRVYANHGRHRDLYGDDYTAAQIFDQESFDWSGCQGSVYHHVIADVGVDGRASHVRVAEDSELTDECEKITIEIIERTQFIPARTKSGPFKSEYSAFFATRDKLRNVENPDAQ